MEDNTSTIIIAILVALPIVAILTAFICIRMRAKRLKEYQGKLSVIFIVTIIPLLLFSLHLLYTLFGDLQGCRIIVVLTKFQI